MTQDGIGAANSGSQEDRIVLPETWQSVSESLVRGPRLYYRLGAPRSLREANGRYRRDPRGRIAFEAFLGLPMDAMFDRYDAIPIRDRRAIDRDLEPDRLAFHELVSFVETFGPFGFDWSRTYPLVNAEADRLAEENWHLQLAAAGFAADGPPPSAGIPRWRVVLPEPGQPFLPAADRVITHPDLAWEQRARLGDETIPFDDIGARGAGPVAWARRELAAAKDLAHALANLDRFKVRDAIRDFPRAPVFDVRGRPAASSLSPDWRSANRGIPPADGTFKPFEVHETAVDWFALGTLMLAEHISLKLASTGVGVGLRKGRPTVGWRIGSLLEVMYLQLLDHVRLHPDFGIGTCSFCGAPILQVRAEQRWHSRCAPAGRKRESRAAQKERAEGRPSEGAAP